MAFDLPLVVLPATKSSQSAVGFDVINFYLKVNSWVPIQNKILHSELHEMQADITVNDGIGMEAVSILIIYRQD